MRPQSLTLNYRPATDMIKWHRPQRNNLGGYGMPFDAPYDPRRFPRATRYVADGRLRPLKRVLIANRLLRLAGRAVTGRPVGWVGSWPHYAQRPVNRNSYQERNRKRLRELLTAMAKARVQGSTPAENAGNQFDSR